MCASIHNGNLWGIYFFTATSSAQRPVFSCSPHSLPQHSVSQDKISDGRKQRRKKVFYSIPNNPRSPSPSANLPFSCAASSAIHATSSYRLRQIMPPTSGTMKHAPSKSSNAPLPAGAAVPQVRNESVLRFSEYLTHILQECITSIRFQITHSSQSSHIVSSYPIIHKELHSFHESLNTSSRY